MVSESIKRSPAWVPMYISDWFVASTAMPADEFKDMVSKLCLYVITDERPVFNSKFANLILDRFDVEIPKSKNRSAQGSAAAQKKWQKRDNGKEADMPEHMREDMPEHMREDMPTHMQPTPTPTPTLTETPIKEDALTSIQEKLPAVALEHVAKPQKKLGAYSPEFEGAFELYGHRVDKLAAFKAWRKAIDAGATIADITDGIGRYVAWRNRTETIPKHMATWLNGRCWESEYLDGKDFKNGRNCGSQNGGQPVSYVAIAREIIADRKAKLGREQPRSMDMEGLPEF